MRLGFVVQRYGPGIVGGSEAACRGYAEHLAGAGHDVEVLTTTAREATTWAEAEPAGESLVNGVRVRRFPVRAGRSPAFDRFSRRVLADPEGASRRDQERWVELQGPVCPELVECVGDEHDRFDALVFYTYLYYPTVMGIRRAGARTVLQPTTHDERPIYLPLYRDVFAAPRALSFFTHAERELTERLFPLGDRLRIVEGIGVEPPAAVGGRAVEEPYLLYLGRVDDGKGCGVLAELFALYKRRRPGPLRLVFAGPVANQPPPSPDVVVLGPLDEAAKWGALAGAEIVVQPSAYESYGLVVLEAWTAGTPVLVNAYCAATREHVSRAHGGLWFDGYPGFEAAVDRLVADADLRATLAAQGRRYVDDHFQWPGIVDRFAARLADVAALPPPRSGGGNHP